MPPNPPLDSLGERLVVCGPSASGKSTLAVALGKRLDLPVVHLDALRFIPGTDWVERPDDDFSRDVSVASEGDRWVIEGNYFRFMPPRLARATGIACLDGSRLANYLSYLRRTLLDPVRVGGLAGGSERINWRMTRWILIEEPRRRQAKVAGLRKAQLPMAYAPSRAALVQLYADWNLPRPRPHRPTTPAQA